MWNLSGIELTWDLIMRVYVIVALTMNVFSLPLVLVLYKKKPSFIRKIDAAVDRFIDGKKGKPEKKAGETEKKESPKDGEKTEEKGGERRSIEELNDQSGISNIVLYVGDTYKCMLSELDRMSIQGNSHQWKSSNTFVGDFDNGNRFKADKVGATFLSYSGMRLYYIDVRPMKAEWFMRPLIETVLGGRSVDAVKCDCRKERILAYRKDAGRGETLSYPLPERKGMFTVSADRTGRVDRMTVQAGMRDEEYADVRVRFSEYFRPIDGKTDTGLWYHKWETETESIDETGIDYVAFLRFDGKTMTAGICRSWRRNAEVEEIRVNPSMIMRQFLRMLPKQELAGSIAPLETEDAGLTEVKDPKAGVDPLTDRERKMKNKQDEDRMKDKTEPARNEKEDKAGNGEDDGKGNGKDGDGGGMESERTAGEENGEGVEDVEQIDFTPDGGEEDYGEDGGMEKEGDFIDDPTEDPTERFDPAEQ